MYVNFGCFFLNMKIILFWDFTPCNLVMRFRGTECLNLQGESVMIFFYTEDDGSRFLQNICNFVMPDYIVS